MENTEQLTAPIQITEKTVVVDARPRFDYTMAHIPRSVSIIWSDFTEPAVGQTRGLMQKDLFAATRRLARFGINPNTPVVVVGRGLEGEGEEGRVAWMLSYLGVKQIQFSALGAFKANLVNTVEETPAASVPIWKPEVVDDLLVTREEVLFAINKRAVEQPSAFRKGAKPALYRLIDVRTSKEYLGRGAKRHVPNIDAINIPWQEFFDKDFRPNKALAAKLKGVGILPEHRIIILDNDGVASAAVTMALRGLGFNNAGNYAGGLSELLSRSLD